MLNHEKLRATEMTEIRTMISVLIFIFLWTVIGGCGLAQRRAERIQAQYPQWDQATVEGQVGDLLSLLPVGGDAQGVSSLGLEYALDDETLWFGPARGISNVLVSPTASVSVRKGLLWAVHTQL